MTTVDKSVAPYYDDFDPSKKYTQILFNPGRYLQARELTQTQTMLYEFLKRLSDTLLKDGAIVSGMGFQLNGNTLTVEDGRVYINGKIHLFNQQSVTLTLTGTELVGVKLQESIITENQDATLNSPELGEPSYGLPGAHRIKSDVVLTLNDPDAFTIYEFENGVLKTEPAKPQLDGILQILAKRTYDEAGNYRVNGFDLHVDPYDANNVQLTVEAGLAYVMGYQVQKPAPTKVLIPLSKATRTVTAEPKVFNTGTMNYPLNNLPVKQIDKVVAVVQKTVTMTRGGVPGGIDYLPNTSIVQIVSVADGVHGTYQQGTDYVLTNDGVDWSPSGAEPNPGATYTVTYQYNKVMVQGTDYQLYTNVDQFGTATDYVKFLSGGDLPVNNTTFTVDYDHYLARVDVISLDKDGNIIVTQGQPDLARLVNPPAVNDPTLLKLGTVYLPPNSGNAVATGGAVTRLRMEDLQHMLERLNDVEYNQAVTALDREAMQGVNATDLKGIFSDSFRSTSKADLGHPQFSVMFHLEEGMIMLPPNSTKTSTPIINQATSNIATWGRLISAPFTEVVAARQPYATQSMFINPYLVFSTTGNLKLTPSFDNWVDTERIIIEKNQTVTRNFYRWWKYAKLKDRVEDLFADNIKLENGQSVSTWRGGIGDSTDAIKTEKSVQAILESEMYMRQLTINFEAHNLVPNSDNLQLFFDDVLCPITPAPGYLPGTLSGSIRADSNGVAKGSFTIPAGIRTGTRLVVLKNGNCEARTTFTSIGFKRTLKETIFHTKIHLTIVDPLAQTFQFEEDRILTSVGVYFAGKDLTKNVVVQIRNVVNGYPSNIVYAEKVLTPSDIQTSADATRETKITFDDPVYCEANTQYALVLMTDSAVPSVYVAELGKNDITTGKQVSYQPYLAGLLFSSKNAVTWTAHQTMNMKFNLYTAQFQPTGVVEFQPIQNLSADRILLLVDYLTPKNTGCTWEMKLDNGNYLPISAYEDVDLNQPVNTVQLRATFQADKYMSPMIPVDGFSFIGFLSAQNGSYISLNVTGFDRNIHHVKQVFEAHIPTGCTIQPQFSVDGGQTWMTPTLTSSTQISSDFTQYVYELDVPDSLNARQFKARLNLSANSSVLRPVARKFMNIIT